MVKLLVSLIGVLGILVGSGFAGDTKAGSTSASTDPEAAKYRRYAEGLLKQYDTNHNGVLDREEWGRMQGNWKSADLNGDGILTLDEITAHLVGFSRSRREPAGAKYYKLSKTELQQELKKLQKELLPVEREVNGPYLALRKAQQDYQSASEEQKFDALLRFLEARAALRKPQFRQQELRYHEIQNEFQAAQEAYVKLLEQ